MGAYSFQKQFLPFVLSGDKRHTIRAVRKNPDQPGSTLSLYYAMRTKQCRLLFRAPCMKVEQIRIAMAKGPVRLRLHFVEIEGQQLDDGEREQLACRDGFSSFQEMMKFWDGRLPFIGHIIHWDYEKRFDFDL